MKARIEAYLTRHWYSPARPPWLLRLLVPVYRAVATRRWALNEDKPPCPVIVVGNITVGGSGKTPVVVALARALRSAGRSPAIISRGYGGQRNDRPRAVTAASDPDEVGDEPVMLARRAGCPVWVCVDRQAALEAARRGGADAVLADDGLQHPRLPRSYEICVIDGLRGLGNEHLLPAGPLRQPLGRLDSVDQVLIKQSGAGRRRSLPAGVGFELEPGRPYRLDAPERSGPMPSGREYDAVCAIGNPESFFLLLDALGYRFRRRAFPDHHRFEAADIRRLTGPLIVTEKDAVKLERLEGIPETWVLPIEARLPPDSVEAVLAHMREFQAT